MEKWGLRKNPTFESLLDSKTYEIDERIHIYHRAASSFREGFFSAPPPDEEVVDEGHDGRHERMLAQMRAAAAEIAMAADRHRAQAAETFRQGMPEDAQTAHEAATPNILGQPQSFAERTKNRQGQFKENEQFTFRKELNRMRQDARQAAERKSLFDKKRRQPMQFNIATPPSPRDYDRRLQGKYDERLLKSIAQRNPQVKRPQTAPTQNERLAQARVAAEQAAKTRSALQIARKRPRPERDVNTRIRKRRLQ